MSSTESPISITVKTTAGSLVTVRASTGEELDMLVAGSLASLQSAVTELEAAVKPASTAGVVNFATPPNPQVASIATAFNATEISGAPLHAFDATPGAGGRMCPHGTMTRIHGLTGKFGPYKGHFCPAKQGDPSKCTTQYIKPNDPTWATFQADQTKA